MPKTGSSEAAKNKQSGFIQWFLALLSGTNDPEFMKRRLLKEIEKELKKPRFRFYRPRDKQALPPLGKFFYDIYKAVGPAQLIIDRADSSQVLKSIIVESVLNEHEVALLQGLSEEALRDRYDGENGIELVQALRGELKEISTVFTDTKVTTIDAVYNLLLIFLQFINFDYYFLLRKFDSRLPERDFRYHPHFEVIDGSYVSDDLKDFLEVIPLLSREADWTKLFEVLQRYKDSTVINVDGWKKVLKTIFEVRNSQILEKIVRHIDDDPFVEITVSPPNDHIVDTYVSTLKLRVEAYIRKLLNVKKDKETEELLQTIFETTAVSRLRFYTETGNQRYTKKMMSGFRHTALLNYAAAFLADYVKNSMKPEIDLLLIQGLWITADGSQTLSKAYHELNILADEVVRFDEALSSEGEYGKVLDEALKKTELDKSHAKELAIVLDKINKLAYGHVKDATRHIVFLGKSLKPIIEDINKAKPEIINNWKDLQANRQRSLREIYIEIYQKIFYFMKLVELETKTD